MQRGGVKKWPVREKLFESWCMPQGLLACLNDDLTSPLTHVT